MKTLRYLALVGLFAYGISLLAMTGPTIKKIEEIKKMNPSDLSDYTEEMREYAETIKNPSDRADFNEEYREQITLALAEMKASKPELPPEDLEATSIKKEKEAFHARIKELRELEVNPPHATWLARAEYTAQAIRELNSKAELLRNAISKMPAESFFGAKSPEKQKLEAQLELIKDTIIQYARAGLAGYMNDYMKPVDKADEEKYNKLLGDLTKAAKAGYVLLGGYGIPKTDSYSASTK